MRRLGKPMFMLKTRSTKPRTSSASPSRNTIWCRLHGPMPSKRAASRNAQTAVESASRTSAKYHATPVRRLRDRNKTSMRAWAPHSRRSFGGRQPVLAAIAHHLLAVRVPEPAGERPERGGPEELQREESRRLSHSGVDRERCPRDRSERQPLQRPAQVPRQERERDDRPREDDRDRLAHPEHQPDRLLEGDGERGGDEVEGDRKSTRLNSSHLGISYAVFC